MRGVNERKWAFVCCRTCHCWNGSQQTLHSPTSMLLPGQTKRCFNRSCVARIPRCDSQVKTLKTMSQKFSRTRLHRTGVETSQITSTAHDEFPTSGRFWKPGYVLSDIILLLSCCAATSSVRSISAELCKLKIEVSTRESVSYTALCCSCTCRLFIGNSTAKDKGRVSQDENLVEFYRNVKVKGLSPILI